MSSDVHVKSVSLPPRAILLGVITAMLWGLNFIFIKISLGDVPPLLLSSYRFFFAAFPAVLFLPRPPGSFKLLFLYGLTTFAIQYGFLFTAMKFGAPPGLSSLLLQVQVFFTIGLSAVYFKTVLPASKIVGAIISFSGVMLVGLHTTGEVTITQIVLLLSGSLGWSFGNIFAQKIKGAKALNLVVWGSLFALPFLIPAALVMEGPAAIWQSITHTHWPAVLSLAYTVYISTLLCFTLWSHLISRYGASTVVPFTLLVPVTGFVSSVLVLGESLPSWKIWASVLVLTGLFINMYSPKKTRTAPA